MPSNGIHGKGCIAYLSISAAAAAVSIGEQLDWSIDYEQPLVDVTPLNNTWKSFVKGLSGWTGTLGGNFDSTTAVLWTASLAVTKSNFYLYPLGASAMGQYYYGTCWVTLGKIASGSTTSKASQTVKLTGDGALTPI